MKMSKRQYRIGELAKALDVEKFVIRFWEKELGIKSYRSKGGQRFYEEKDFKKFETIKNLLYDKKYTLAGAKKELENLKKGRNVIASQSVPKITISDYEQKLTLLKQELLRVKQELLKVKETL
ncbi:MerR family transcriptional regulator [Candidatus Dependentiae bacterium]|nr:MerR family transcriptional regulator [Candidatus Dependentiae bacterium]